MTNVKPKLSKIRDRLVATDCAPLSFKELTEIRKQVHGTLVLSITGELKRLMTMVGAPDPAHVPKDILIAD
jgi:hypothetical protein